MITAKLTNFVDLGSNHYSKSYEIPNVDFGNISDEIMCVLLSDKGIIRELKIVCDSDLYDISIRQKAGITLPSDDEILQYSGIDTFSFSLVSGNIFYINNDGVGVNALDNLYLKVDNTNGTINTGTIKFQLMIERK